MRSSTSTKLPVIRFERVGVDDERVGRRERDRSRCRWPRACRCPRGASSVDVEPLDHVVDEPDRRPRRVLHAEPLAGGQRLVAEPADRRDQLVDDLGERRRSRAGRRGPRGCRRPGPRRRSGRRARSAGRRRRSPRAGSSSRCPPGSSGRRRRGTGRRRRPCPRRCACPSGGAAPTGPAGARRPCPRRPSRPPARPRARSSTVGPSYQGAASEGSTTLSPLSAETGTTSGSSMPRRAASAATSATSAS